MCHRLFVSFGDSDIALRGDPIDIRVRIKKCYLFSIKTQQSHLSYIRIVTAHCSLLQVTQAWLFFQTGLRFSKNACIPSRASGS